MEEVKPIIRALKKKECGAAFTPAKPTLKAMPAIATSKDNFTFTWD